MFLSAYMHFFIPEIYTAMIPEFIPESLANIGTGILELGVGILLILPQYRHWGGLAFMLLMIGLLPIHVWELFRENPAIGSSSAAIARFIAQFLLIYAGWRIWKQAPSN